MRGPILFAFTGWCRGVGEAEDLLNKDKPTPAQEAKVRSLLEQAGALLKAKPKAKREAKTKPASSSSSAASSSAPVLAAAVNPTPPMKKQKTT